METAELIEPFGVQVAIVLSNGVIESLNSDTFKNDANSFLILSQTVTHFASAREKKL